MSCLCRLFVHFSPVKNTMTKHVALLLILFPVCGHLLDIKFYNNPYEYTWEEAVTFCRKNHTDLVRVRTAEENKALQYSGWIGLSRKDATSPWKWSRGDEIAIFIPWDGGKFSYYVFYSLDVTWLTRPNLLVIIPNLFAL